MPILSEMSENPPFSDISDSGTRLLPGGRQVFTDFEQI